MSTVIVDKLDENGVLVWQYTASVLNREVNSIRLEAFFDQDDLDLGFTVLKKGDRFIETFYCDRWYNVFAVHDRDDRVLKGWYCNICRPAAIGDSAVRCEDLALDLWVTPTDQIQILDEEDFDVLNLDDEERKSCRLALQELQGLAYNHLLPC